MTSKIESTSNNDTNQRPSDDNNEELPPPYNPIEISSSNSNNIKQGAEQDPLITSAPTATLISQPGLLPLTQRGSATLICPFENIPIITEVKYEAGLKAGVCSAIACFIFWPLFWLPLVMRSSKEEVHYCPSCKRAIAIGP